MNSTETDEGFDAGRLVGISIGAYARNFPAFLMTAAVLFSPCLLLWWLATKNAIGDPRFFVFAVFLAFTIFDTLVTILLCYAVWDDHAERPVSLVDSFKAVRPRILVALGTGIVINIAAVVANLLFVVPGLVVFILTWIVVPICIVEKKTPLASVKRSFSLLHIHWRTIVAMVVVLFVVDGLPSRFLVRELETGKMPLDTYLLISIALAAFIAPLRAALVAIAYGEADADSKRRTLAAVRAATTVFGDIPEATATVDTAPIHVQPDETPENG